jgi:glycosyltransferase involved in cell wall biosynthesis
VTRSSSRPCLFEHPAPRVIYLGPFTPEHLAAARGLPRNPAAYNRMLRLAKALADSNHSVHVATTGICLAVKLTQNLFHRGKSMRIDGISVTALPALGIPLLGYLLEPLILTLWLLKQMLKDRPIAIVVYNATPAAAIAVLAPVLFGLKVVYEIEDVPVLKATAGSSRAERPRFFRNLSWLIASRVLINVAHSFIAPSSRLVTKLGLSPNARKRTLVIPGCMDVTATIPSIASLAVEKRPLRILFCGKLEAEHGYDLLLEAIELLAREPDFEQRFEFHVCGSSQAGHRHPERVLTPPNVQYHGFVSNDTYRQLLESCDVGLALQKASGTYRDSKTPSKAYEFLGSGKLLVATLVGDLSELFPHAAVLFEPESGEALARLLDAIPRNPHHFIQIAETGLCLARERYSLRASGRSLSSLIQNTCA